MLNKVTLIGNLGAKPELTFLESGQAVCKMSLATNEKWKDKEGKPQERVEWHKIVVWGKTGENCAQYLDKGRQVYLEGRIQTRSWDDKESGEKKYMTEIVATNVKFLGQKEGGGTRRGDDAPPPSESEAPPSGGDDDIPF